MAGMGDAPPSYELGSGRRLDGSYARFPDPLRIPQLDTWLESAEIDAVRAAEWRSQRPFQVARRVDPTASVSLYIRGRSRLLLDRTPLELGPGDLLVLPPGVPFSETLIAGPEMLTCTCHFHAYAFGGVDLVRLIGFPPRIHLGRSDTLVVDLMRRICREFAVREPGYRTAASGWLRALLQHVIRHHGSRFAPSPAASDTSSAARLLPAFELIERRLDDPELGIAQLARAAGLSASRLRASFVRATGDPPVRYLRRRRIAAACRLLKQDDAPIERIAASVGFSDARFFHRVFRALLGTSPARFRSARW
jgi:AraC-like DNA-binding protein